MQRPRAAGPSTYLPTYLHRFRRLPAERQRLLHFGLLRKRCGHAPIGRSQPRSPVRGFSANRPLGGSSRGRPFGSRIISPSSASPSPPRHSPSSATALALSTEAALLAPLRRPPLPLLVPSLLSPLHFGHLLSSLCVVPLRLSTGPDSATTQRQLQSTRDAPRLLSAIAEL